MRYAELHCRTNFSFLEGASHADELVRRADELGYAALAVTDRNSLSGVVRAHTAAKEVGLKLIIGAEITPEDAPPVVMWATDRAAYGQLSQLITVGRRRVEKGNCQTYLNDIDAHSEGLIAGICIRPDALSPSDGNLDISSCLPQLQAYREVFSDRGYLLAELHRGPDDRQWLRQLMQLSQKSSLPLLAAGDVHYHVPGRIALHDVLTAIRQGTTVDKIGRSRFANAQRHLRDVNEIEELFSSVPEALRRTQEVTDQCHFRLDELRYEYPEELAPQGLTPFTHLQELTWRGAHKRYPRGIPDKVRQLLQHELCLIKDLQYEAYFLTVWDLVRFARKRGILCQGRGSAANSAVCFCLGVTSVDPDRTDLLFERFVSRERDEVPDIDVDFEHERREEVLQYVYEKYGRDRAGIAAEVITYRTRSAVRDVGKALGLSLDRVDTLSKNIEGYHHEPQLDHRCREIGIDPASSTGQRLIYLIQELIGFPRHLSQHVGGMVITQGPLSRLVPIENAAMQDRTVISWDKNDLDELGILKIDCLALGMLTAIRKCFAFVKQHFGREVTLANIPEGDDDVYDMICQADTIGVFQIESRAQMSMLPRLKPRSYYDLVIEVAIVRPGPIQGQMVHPYLRRRAGDEPVTYANDDIRRVLQKTKGVPIFQEQAMRLAVVAAGFTPGEADQLRRAMGAWRRPGIIDKFRQKLIDGMLTRGLTRKFAEQIFHQIRGFGEYGFPESHAASFALLVYVSAWLKHYYPQAFAAALLNSQPMGFYAPAQLISDARKHGVTVLPVDVNGSDWDCKLRKDEGRRAKDEKEDAKCLKTSSNFVLRPSSFVLILGFRMVSGLSRESAETIIEARQNGPFRSQEDFSRRTQLSPKVISRLAQADAFASLGRDRRQAFWESLLQENPGRDAPLFHGIPAEDEPPVVLPRLTPLEEVLRDYETTGLSLKAHPLSFYREQLKQLKTLSASQLTQIANNTRVRVAGLVILRQRPSTAKGITFVTLEDETGTANLVVRQPVWQQYYAVARRSPAWLAHGKLETKDSVIHLVVERLEDLGKALELSVNPLKSKSRDFR